MPQSPWQEFFRDSELLDVIKLDLSRTYPDLEFFQSEQTQRQMLHILFVWSKLNASTSYRQGMNELLAPLLLLVAAEAIPHAQVSVHVRPILNVMHASKHLALIARPSASFIQSSSCIDRRRSQCLKLHHHLAGRGRSVRLVCVRAERALH